MPGYLFIFVLLFEAAIPNHVSAFTSALWFQKRDADADALQQFSQQVLRSHNKYRSQHCAPSLVLDDTLTQSAQSYAQYLADTSTFVHSQNRQGVGENLYKMMSSAPITQVDGSVPTNSWYKEVKNYNFDSPGFSSNTGHFTQLVWKGSQNLGVGLAFSSDKKQAYVVAHYSPGGNILNDFGNNVLPTDCSNSK